METLKSIFVVHLFEPDSANYESRELPDLRRDEAIATARALALHRRVDLWLGNTKIGSFPPRVKVPHDGQRHWT